MNARVVFGVALLALLCIAIAVSLHRDPVPTSGVDAPEPTGAIEAPAPAQDFAAAYMAARAEALMKEARDEALAAAREEEQQRWETLRQQLFGPVAQDWRRGIARESPVKVAAQRAQRFESETVDRTWAPATEAQILEKISQTGVNALDLRVECRTTVCRLEVLAPATERLTSARITGALLQIADLAPSLSKQVDSPAGTRATVAYLARK